MYAHLHEKYKCIDCVGLFFFFTFTDVNIRRTLAFNDKDFVVPLIVAYDATNRKSLNILHITFLHDEFDVLGIKYSVECMYNILCTKNSD